ncbi:MAG: Rieske 2Fe-2S domain-containing protein [Terriglobales bacterium]
MIAVSVEQEKEHAYLAALREFYHPVATLQELEEVGIDERGMQRVLPKELLGERIVIARLQGAVVAMHGTCPHRGVALARGWVIRAAVQSYAATTASNGAPPAACTASRRLKQKANSFRRVKAGESRPIRRSCGMG